MDSATNDYVDSWLPQFDSRGLQPSIAIVTGYDATNAMIPKFQEWINAGRDLNSHSWSHQYFQSPSAFTIRYTGTRDGSDADDYGERVDDDGDGRSWWGEFEFEPDERVVQHDVQIVVDDCGEERIHGGRIRMQRRA